MPPRVPRRRRARVFGRDPGAYDRARLRYPPALWALLERRCGLRRGTSVLEIGPGTGIATRELLRRSGGPMTLVEPDRRLVRYLHRRLRDAGATVTIVPRAFERASLPPSSFDLAVAATSFHWLPLRPALRRVARSLRPGGWWAAWNSHHGDPYRPSRFQDELQPLYAQLRGRAAPYDRGVRSDRRERDRRFAALRSVGAFERPRREEIHWTATLSARRVAALWATFSEIQTLPTADRRRFLAKLDRLVRTRFGGRVRLRILTAVYTARRRTDGSGRDPRRPRRPRSDPGPGPPRGRPEDVRRPGRRR